ncbi:hypothetical protein ACFO5K_18140 [Nocardia halotolerans]|uniref:PknH-like extracellular domain-containing protein n=1 Tax=Nocardia halotolerans TaxID=1755878 RepID=A0ABV8VMZ0_9NOCA
MMRSRVRAVASACAVLAGVVACGSADEDCASDDSCPPTWTRVAAAPGTGDVIDDPARLTAGLLAETDLPGEFTLMPPRPPADEAAVPPVAPTDPPDCARLLTPLAQQWPGAAADAAVHFAGPSYATIDIDAASYSDSALGTAFTALQERVHRCGAYTGDDAGVHIDYRAAPLSQPPAGAASSAFTLTATSEGLTLTSATSLVQVGNTLVQVVITAPEAVDPEVLSELTAAQVRKLRG